MKTIAEPVTQTKILDAAEQAFAEVGFEGASMRQIVGAAGVNLATVYYYFGSKQELMAAVFSRRFGPLAQEQVGNLRALERQLAGKSASVEKILEAIIVPPLRLTTGGSREGMTVARLIGRLVTEPTPQTQALLTAQYRELRAALREALHKACPALPLLDLQWRMEFSWGALAFVMCNAANIKEKTGGLCDPAKTQQVLAQLIATFAAAFRAPPAAAGKPI